MTYGLSYQPMYDKKKRAIRAESQCHGAETQKTTQAQIIAFSSNSVLTALAGRQPSFEVIPNSFQNTAA